MGVPGFFAWLLKYKNNIIIEKIDVKVDCLYFDANCLFHPKCFEMLKLHWNESNINRLENKMILHIIEYIQFIIDYVKPVKSIFIAVDGVAPIAKIDQQRKRRYKSYHENLYRNQLMDKYNIPHNDSWSNVVITPGTEFMQKLDKKITEFVNKLRNQNNPLKINYSSYKEEGEGEHKIYKFMKETYQDKMNLVHVIYGLDADLIFLSLSSQYSSIFLLRETEDLKSVSTNKTKFCYVNIDEVRKTINQLIKSKIENENVITDYVKDFIFVCFFLGNDFIPHFPSIDIKRDGMDILINSYLDTIFYTNEPIINEENNINIQSFKVFIHVLATYEEQFLKERLLEFLKREERMKCQSSNNFDKEIFEYENLKKIDKKDPFDYFNNQIPFDVNRFKYYSHHFNITSNQNEYIDVICESLLEIISWVIKYYFEGCTNWRIKYEFNHAPFITDLNNYINKDIFIEKFNSMQSNIKQNKLPFTINQQLISVIPVQYKNKLPSNLHKYYGMMELIEMLPINFDMDYHYKSRLYLCDPILPYLNQDKIRELVK